LLKEYVDLFPQNFTEIKGIKGELGEMRIELKPDAKPIKRRSYRLNPRIKERVNPPCPRVWEQVPPSFFFAKG